MLTARKLIDSYILAFDNSDLDAIQSLYDPDATLEDPVGTPVLRGIDEIMAFYTEAFMLNVTLEPRGPLTVSGNSIAFPFIGRAPTQSVEVIDVFDLSEQGRIMRMRAYWGPDNVHLNSR